MFKTIKYIICSATILIVAIYLFKLRCINMDMTDMRFLFTIWKQEILGSIIMLISWFVMSE